MAVRLEVLKAAAGFNKGCGGLHLLLRHLHVAAAPLDGSISPEFNRNNNDLGFAFHGSMDLMAVPKRKTTPHKRGIRNGPKALKPTPVIIRCRSCGRVKLPHFYCCSGDRGQPGAQNN
ncbi:50S ribosomal protein L32 [Euphorbia peplus]|nr:50S ribosomal protein L32 [Euphorbia peplus]